ncbi:MAG: threonine synthase [Nitrososphaeria archaeon]|nr:threonine synthase [Nitrososphaeria archaeon]
MNLIYKCTRCSRREAYTTLLERTLCRCGSPYLIEYDLNTLDRSQLREKFNSRPKSVWRYLELLPPIRISPISMGEGGTYLHSSRGLGRLIGLRKLYIKNESTNPTGAFTDRGATVEISRDLEVGVSRIICIASGNLSVSISAYSAKAGIPCSVYLKTGVEQVKVLQALAYDAEVFFTSDLESVITSLTQELASCHLITSSNPFLIEGYKTCTLEVLDELNWVSPDWILIPVGSGSHITALWKAVKEVEEIGLLKDGLPSILGGQINSCAPIAEAYKNNSEDIKPTSTFKVIFPDIAEPNPIWGHMALKAVRESSGEILTVSQERLLEAIKLLAKSEGILAEPAAAVSLATLIDAVDLGLIKRDETVVYIVTGSGMKDPSTIQSIAEIKTFERPNQFKRIGSTKKKILEILDKKPLHGYGIQRELANHYGIKVKLPTIYEHLSDLYSIGLIQLSVLDRARSKRTQKKYSLTDFGKEFYKRTIQNTL